MLDWSKPHSFKVGNQPQYVEEPTQSIKTQREEIEPWLTALFQSEHLGLLVGNGLSRAVAALAQISASDMEIVKFENFDREISKAAQQSAEQFGRGEPNFEDQIRVANQLIQGLSILGQIKEAEKLQKELDKLLLEFLIAVCKTEEGLAKTLSTLSPTSQANTEKERTYRSIEYLVAFLLSFASRAAGRERLHIFTINYDRLVEYGADWAGIRLLDRFVGTLAPIFRSSRLDVDLHYNPPGIRGEPRYLEGVVRYTKLHGSVDWRLENRMVRRAPLPFGAPAGHPALPADATQSLLIYPNAAKDRETADYPYVELFRDYAAAVCRPNSVLVTYGYGYGDDHINRVIEDMLTIPSAHLLIMSRDDPGRRISRFYQRVVRPSQISTMFEKYVMG